MSQEKRPTAEQMAKFKKNAQDQSLSAEIRAKFQAIVDKFAEDVAGGDEPKKRGRKPATPRATRKPATPRATKKTTTDVEQAKAEIKAKTGKTEAECEAIIEQYRALRTKAQEGKRKAEQASATNKKRVEKLDQKGDLIEGTNVKTADAVIESTAKDVAEKIEQQIEAVEEKAEKEAKAEVAKDKTIKTTTEKKEAVEAKVEKKVKEKTKTIVKRVVIDTSALLTSIADSLGKFDKDSQKEFLIKLRSDIDKLLAKYAFGGMTNGATQVMNIQQSNLSASSVNPTMFANGGVIGQEIVFDDNGEENSGVIKDITNLGDYVVKADDGRTLLAQRDLDVISLGAMRQQGVEQRKKRFGFFGKGGSIGSSAKLKYINDAFASYELQDDLRKKLGIDENAYSVGDNVVISFAYTDYGGDFLDKVAIEYFKENYPDNTLSENTSYSGENAFVFGEPAQEWIDSTEDYPLGFEDFEGFYSEKENDAEYESYEYFLSDLERDYTFDTEEVMSWLMENKGGYYSMTTQGLDFSSSDLTDELLDEGLISKEDDEDEIGVRSSNKDFHRINLDKGQRYRKGGNVTSMLRNRRGQ